MKKMERGVEKGANRISCGLRTPKDVCHLYSNAEREANPKYARRTVLDIWPADVELDGRRR
jgi:hypothetical protein